MEPSRGTAEHLSSRLEADPILLSEVRRLRAAVRTLILTQVGTLLLVFALVAVVERRTTAVRDAVWDAANKAEKAAREELPGAVATTRARLQEVQAQLQAIDTQARSLSASLAPGGEAQAEARRVAEDLKKGVRQTVQEAVRESVKAELARQKALEGGGTP